MAADVDQQGFVRGDSQGQGQAIAVGNAYGLQALQLATEGVQFQAGALGAGR